MTISEPTLKGIVPTSPSRPNSSPRPAPMRKNIRRFGKYGLDVEDLPDPLVPKPLPFELPL